MKRYKIGRYFYQEITEEKYCELREEYEYSDKRVYPLVFSLDDYDGEPIKYFKRIRK